MKLVSIIIVVKNDRGISATIDNIKKQNTELHYEVIVVDASEPSVLADIKAKNSWVTWDQFPVSKKRTTPEQRNRGLELAKGDVIVFIDANCIPGKNWLTSIIESLKDGEDIVCGPVLDLSKTNLVHYHEELKSGSYVDDCTTINVGLKRKVFDRVGVFDTTFSYGQDVDFFWRAKDEGYKFYFNPSVEIGHDWGEPKEQLTRAYQYGKARAHLFKKHWHSHRHQLIHEAHVLVYPIFIIGLPITYFFPFYPLLILVPMLKNRSSNPTGLVLHHLVYGLGVLAGTLKIWPKEPTTQLNQEAKLNPAA